MGFFSKIAKGHFALLVISFSACSSARIDTLERQTADDVRELRSIQAEHTAALNEVRTEIRQLSGQIEELQYVAQGKTKELERSLLRLGTRVPPPAGVPEDLLSRDEQRITAIKGEAADQFRTALSKLRAGDFEGAEQDFSSFVQTNPGTAFTDNALFWMGIAHMKLGQYDRAILSFSDVFTQFPAEDMVPAALYYLADTFDKSGAKEDAKLTFQKLVDEHPRSNLAKDARKKVAELRRRRR